MGKKRSGQGSSARGGARSVQPSIPSLNVTSLVQLLEAAAQGGMDQDVVDLGVDAAIEFSHRVSSATQSEEVEKKLVKQVRENRICERLVVVAMEGQLTIAAAAMVTMWEIIDKLDCMESYIAKEASVCDQLGQLARTPFTEQTYSDQSLLRHAKIRQEHATKTALRLERRAKSWWFNGGKDTSLARELTDSFCALLNRFGHRGEQVHHRIAATMADAEEWEASATPREDLIHKAIAKAATLRKNLETEEEVLAELDALELFAKGKAAKVKFQARFDSGMDDSLLRDARNLRLELAAELLARRGKHEEDGEFSDEEDVEVDQDICDYCGVRSEPLVINMDAVMCEGKKMGGKRTIAGKEFSRCGGCHVRHYCSVTCSNAAWRRHKVACECLRIQSGYGPAEKSKLATDAVGRERLQNYSSNMRLAGYCKGTVGCLTDEMVLESLLPLLRGIGDGTMASPFLTTPLRQEAGKEKGRSVRDGHLKERVGEGGEVRPVAMLSDARVMELADEVLSSCPDLGCKGIHKRLAGMSIQVSVDRLKRLGYARHTEHTNT